MPTRNISLTGHYDSFVEDNVRTGRFGNASEVVRAGLALLERDQSEHAAKLAALRAAVAEGVADLDNGRYIDFGSSEALNTYLQGLVEAGPAHG
jgi:antitoxin ParD1/3/4